MRFLVNHAVFALMVLPLLTVPERLCAQQETVTYRKNNEAIVANLDSADYVRVIRAPRLGFELPQLEEYYPNEQLKRKGNILDAESYPKFHGAVVEYYENGRKKSEAFYDEGLRVGQAKYYYRNGQLKKEMWHGKRPNDQTNEFTDVVTDTLVNYYDSLGTALVVNGAGYVREEIGKDFEEGEYRGGVRVGKWIGSFQKQRYTFSEQYENGVVVYGVSTDRQGNTFPYSSIQTPPQYNGG